MDGKQVFLFTMSNIPNIVLDLLKKNKNDFKQCENILCFIKQAKQ